MPSPDPQDYQPPSAPWPERSGGQPSSTPGYGSSTPGYGPSTPGYGGPLPGYAQPPTNYAPPPPPAYAPPSYPIQPGYAPGYIQSAPVGVPAQTTSNGWATASLILGLVGLCTGLAGIAAVICGHIGLNEINRSGGRFSGKGLAIAGLVMGYIEIASMLLFALSNIPH